MESNISNYLTEITVNQNLSQHTIKAYRIDLTQVVKFFKTKGIKDVSDVKKEHLNEYLIFLKQTSKIKTIKRKFVSIKKFFNYLLYEEVIASNPFNKIILKLKADITIPKTIEFNEIKKMYTQVYLNYYNHGLGNIYYLTEVLIIELLYTTGIRVAELCNIKTNDINYNNKTILINGKGRKERIVFVHNIELIYLIKKYIKSTRNYNSKFFLKNMKMTKLSEQSVRLRIKRITKEACIISNITPHMFRHTFATALLEEEVNLMYIQDLLGHSSLTTTQIYITINKKKQQKVISRKHPRRKILTLLNKG